jgi:thiamine biosynthesis lipoprotein
MDFNPVDNIWSENSIFQKIVFSMATIQFMRKSSSDGKNLLYAWFEAIHTRIDLLLYAEVSHEHLESTANAVQKSILEIEAIANRFNPESELYYINKYAFAHSCSISEKLAEMIQECLLFREKTFGSFDITVNSFNHFRFGTAFIHLNFKEKTITFQHPDIQIDLNGYLKGYALRCIAPVLDKYFISNALINMGNSSILAIGNHPYGEGWRVGIDPEYSKKDAEITLFNECLTTSGNSLKHQHIINPETGKYVTENSAVSVVTSDPALGEILSTAFFVADDLRRQWMLAEFPVRLVS